MKQINVTRSSMAPIDEYIKEIEPLWESRWLTNMGAKHNELENKLREYLSVENISLFTNGHLALESVIAAMGLSGEAITTPFTFASTTQAIVRCGMTPVFCDIKPDDFTIDPDKIEALISEKTSAIIPVHVYGNICEVDKIEKIAKKHNLKVIYDAAHAFGVRVGNRGAADFGDASMLSFHATKVFNTIEGGAVVYHDEALTEKLRLQKNFGMATQESYPEVAGNAKLDEFRAAMGLCNLRYVDDDIEKRGRAVERYIERLDGVDGIKVWKPQVGVKANYAYFPVVFEKDKFGKSRNEVAEKLAENSIFARKYFYPITSELECYGGKFEIQPTPIAKYAADNILTLPLYAELMPEDVDKVCDIILR